MPDVTDYDRLRRDVGASATALPDLTAAAIFAEAAETYSGAAAIKAATRVIAIQGLLAAAAAEVDVTQNESTERLSQMSANLRELLRVWQGNLDRAIAAQAASAGESYPPASSTARLRPVW